MRSLTYLMLFVSAILFSQEAQNDYEININNHVDGTLLLKQSLSPQPLAIIIPDAGPTDRNGNQNFQKNNSLKKLAERLDSSGIATFRYDKRIVKEMRRGNVNLNTTIEDFVNDANSVIDYFKEDARFKNIFLIGHGQGSLVALLSDHSNVRGIVSIAGAGQPLDSILLTQIEQTAPGLTDEARRILTTLRAGNTTSDYPEALGSLFSIDIQPFMSSWINYDPADEIAKIERPILIVSGTKDFQVSREDSERLHSANRFSTLQIVEEMNHVMFVIKGDDLENSKSYNESQRKVSTELIKSVIEFIHENN